jgi:hypothetical protein
MRKNSKLRLNFMFSKILTVFGKGFFSKRFFSSLNTLKIGISKHYRFFRRDYFSIQIEANK